MPLVIFGPQLISRSCLHSPSQVGGGGRHLGRRRPQRPHPAQAVEAARQVHRGQHSRPQDQRSGACGPPSSHHCGGVGCCPALNNPRARSVHSHAPPWSHDALSMQPHALATNLSTSLNSKPALHRVGKVMAPPVHHCVVNMLFPPCTRCALPACKQVKAAVTKEDKVMVLLDSHHSEIHVMVGVRVEWPMGKLHVHPGGAYFTISAKILRYYVRMLAVSHCRRCSCAGLSPHVSVGHFCMMLVTVLHRRRWSCTAPSCRWDATASLRTPR